MFVAMAAQGFVETVHDFVTRGLFWSPLIYSVGGAKILL